MTFQNDPDVGILCKNPEDLADYVREYTQEFKSWVTEQDRINAEADRDAE